MSQPAPTDIHDEIVCLLGKHEDGATLDQLAEQLSSRLDRAALQRLLGVLMDQGRVVPTRSGAVFLYHAFPSLLDESIRIHGQPVRICDTSFSAPAAVRRS